MLFSVLGTFYSFVLIVYLRFHGYGKYLVRENGFKCENIVLHQHKWYLTFLVNFDNFFPKCNNYVNLLP